MLLLRYLIIFFVVLLILCREMEAQQGSWVQTSLSGPIGQSVWYRNVGGNCSIFVWEDSTHLHAYDNVSGQWYTEIISTRLPWRTTLAGDSVAIAWNDSLLIGYSALSHNFIPRAYSGSLVGGITGYAAGNTVTCFLTTDSCYVFDAEDSQWHIYRYTPPAYGDSMSIIIHTEKDYLLLSLANRYGWVEKSVIAYSCHQKTFSEYSGDNLSFELLKGGFIFYIDVGEEANQFFAAWSAYTGQHVLVQQASPYPIFVNETNRGTAFMYEYNDMSDYPYIVRYMHGYDTRRGNFVMSSFGYDGEHNTSAGWVLWKNGAVQCARDLDAGDLMEYYIYNGDTHEFSFFSPASPGIGYASLWASNHEPALGNNILLAWGGNNIVGYDIQTATSAFASLPTPTPGYQNPVGYWSTSRSVHAHCKRALTYKFYSYTYNSLQNDAITVLVETVPEALGYGYDSRFEQENVFGFLLKDSTEAYVLLLYSPTADQWTRKVLGGKPKMYGSHRDYIYWSDPANNITIFNGFTNSELQIVFGYDQYLYGQNYIPRDNYFVAYTASNQYAAYSSYTNTITYYTSEQLGIVQPKEDVVLWKSSDSKEYLAYSALFNTFTPLVLTAHDGIGLSPLSGNNTALVMASGGYLYAFNPYGTSTAMDDRNSTHLQTPYHFELYHNYPNPFNPSTTIEFELPKTSNVTLKIFNILGEEVATLVSDKLTAGSYTYEWSRPAGMASGVYLYRLEASDFVETKKMVVIR
jgi:hypothetical protein